MVNNQRIIEIIKNKIENKYKDDVAILALYGSYARGTHDEQSDVDLFFVPKTQRGHKLSFQFIIDGRGYDLFPITWNRLVRIAAFDQPLTAVIADSKVLYSASETDLLRYEGLRNSIFKLVNNASEPVMINKSYEYFNDSYIYLYNMRETNNRLDVQIESSKLISKIVLAVGLANNTYYQGGMGTNIKDSFKLKKRPKEYQNLIETIVSSHHPQQIIDLCEQLIGSTREFLLEQLKQQPDREPYELLFEGYYEELKSVINKMLRACDEKDQHTAFIVASYFHEEVAQFLAKAEEGLWYNDRNYYSEYSESFEKIIDVNLMELVSTNDFTALKETVLEFEEKLKHHLLSRDVEIKVYNTIDEFEEDYNIR